MTTTQQRGFTIRIYIADGSVDGLRIVDKSNWSGQGIVCPRVLFTKHKVRDEFDHTGVYVLIGPNDKLPEKPLIYIGEGDPVKPRLEQHYANRDFWTTVIFFVSTAKHLNKAHVQHLESRLVQIAASVNRCVLQNGNVPQPPSLSEADRDEAEGFLDQILLCLPILGVQAFEQIAAVAATKNNNVLHLRSKGIVASGYDSPQGFIVLTDSQAMLNETPGIHGYLRDLRADLVNSGILAVDKNTYRLTRDYPFGSPSTAAGVLLGRAANGRIEWRDKHGRTLKEIQESE
jgi:hypothetical protein